MKKILLTIAVVIFCQVARSQRVGIGTNTPHSSALLEVKSTDKGFLLPRMTTAQRKAITTPANGLLVYDTDKATIYMFDGVQWLPLTGNANGLSSTVRTANTPTNNAGFGLTVAIDGDYAVISSRNSFEAGNHIDSAFVFHKNNGSWIFQAKLLQSDPVAGDWFGAAVGISGDQAFVGAPKRNAKRGAVYVYTRVGNVWSQTDILTPVNEDPGAEFGASISMEGSYALIGAPNFESSGIARGAAFNFFKGGNGWSQMQAVLGMSTMSNFGYAIDISGSHAVVGAPFADYNNVADAGIAYYLQRTGSFWFVIDTVYNTVPQEHDRFGFAVTLNETANWGFIGRPGRSYAYFKGDVLAYVTTANYFSYEKVLSPPPVNGSIDYFGASLDMTSTYLVVGAPMSGNYDGAQGTMIIYKYDPTWTQYEYRWNPYKVVKDMASMHGPFASDAYGWSVCIDNYDVLWGNPGANHQQGKVMFLNLE